MQPQDEAAPAEASQAEAPEIAAEPAQSNPGPSTTPEPGPPAPASAHPGHDPEPDPASARPALDPRDPLASRTATLRERLRGPWRIAVAEASMLPAIHPGDWLLVDPSVSRWPRRGAIVVFREPETETLSIKRVAGRPGERIPFEGGYLHLGLDEAWLLSDADEATTAAAGFGAPLDSRRYGPVPVDLLVGRAWFRYGPLGRFGRLRTLRPR